MTARIGKELLTANGRLEARVTALEGELRSARDHATQLRHDLQAKNELLQVSVPDDDDDDDWSDRFRPWRPLRPLVLLARVRPKMAYIADLCGEPPCTVWACEYAADIIIVDGGRWTSF